ncbi:MAG: hypothetical protein AB4911_24825, partial [Oscillochloridaceae bacterium umkhey_bin13]
MNPFNAQIKAAIEAHDVDQARALLREALQLEPDAETYYLAAQVALTVEQQQSFLEKAIALDPFHAAADAALRQLRTAPGSLPSANAPTPVTSPSPVAPVPNPTASPAHAAESTSAADHQNQPATPQLQVQPPKPASVSPAGAIFLIIFFIVIPIGFIMYAAGVFDSRKGFEGTWRGTATTNIRCSNGEQGQNSDSAEVRIAINRYQNDRVTVSIAACSFPMRVNGNTASMVPGSPCQSRNQNTGVTLSLTDASFVRSGNSM